MEIILTSIIAFASTNIDDIFILALFFGDKRHKTIDIYIGQFVGISLLIAISLMGSFVGNFVDGRYIGLLGLFPIYLGISQLIGLLRKKNREEVANEEGTKAGFLTVATITFANGGDNIGTYIPLFSALSISDKSIMIGIFLAMVFVWLTLAKYLTKHPGLAKSIARYGHIVTPIVLCILGLFILNENKSFDLLK